MAQAKNRKFTISVPNLSSGNKAQILHLLRERVKELTALHSSARILQDDSAPLAEVFSRILKLLPPAWQYPEITVARIRFDGESFSTPGFRDSPWRQKAAFHTGDGKKGDIEIRYLSAVAPEAEGPFLAEERYLINSIAEMLESYAERKAARFALLNARDELELRVRLRTAELEALNKTLLAEICERKKKERKIRAYQEKLKQMTSEMSLSEERERRNLASELHERLGHNLALIKMKLAQQSNRETRELLPHLNEAIQVTRDLTSELGSPVLYELGFRAALESLAEQFESKHGIKTRVSAYDGASVLEDSVKLILFKAVRELLHNTAKHSRCTEVLIKLDRKGERVQVSVSDNGCGFDHGMRNGESARSGFGLFSIKERLARFGGTIKIKSEKNRGTAVMLEAPVKPPQEDKR